MPKMIAMTGNTAAAEAMRQIDPDVVAAYPITPSTEIMQRFSEFVADELVHTELVTVESEHSAMSACIGAAAAGGRVMNATSAQGLALMWEMLYIAASLRLPIVLVVVNRALSGPINIHGDHSDSMGARDCGWIQLYAENAQECYDSLLQAFRIGEVENVLLPVMVCMDGFIISHSIEPVEVLDDLSVKRFIGEYKPHLSLLDVDNPITMGPLALPNYYMEVKRQQVEAMKHAPAAISEAGKAFKKEFGRDYGFFETYRTEDAELVAVALGSAAGTSKAAVNELRDEGKKVGLLKLRVFRPFPKEELVEALSGAKAIAVLDRCDSFGGRGGPVYHEVRSALYDLDVCPPVVGYIYGLGGRDLDVDEIKSVYTTLEKVAGGAPVEETEYLTVRE